MPAAFKHIAVIGAGAWGSALACVFANTGREVTLWAFEHDTVAEINTAHTNAHFLPGVSLPATIKATSDLSTLADADVIFHVTPAQHTRAISEQYAPHIRDGVPVVICAKGIEQLTHLLLSQVLKSTLPQARLAVLSGPTFAHEVAAGLPAAATLASPDTGLATRLCGLFEATPFRPYVGADMIGAEVGGAVKNVIAIATGIAIGRKMGENAAAALITRGLAEMTRFGVALGGKADTFMGLSGLGDLSLTCNGPASRNMSLGVALGEGKLIDDILRTRKSVAEGYHTAGVVHEMAADRGIVMPVIDAVHAILHEGADIDTVIAAILNRPFTKEAA